MIADPHVDVLIDLGKSSVTNRPTLVLIAIHPISARRALHIAPYETAFEREMGIIVRDI